MQGKIEEEAKEGEQHLQTRKDSKFKWTFTPIKLLLEEYKKRKYMFRMKGTKKKDLWSDILRVFCSAGYTSWNEEDLDRKFRNMKKTFTTIKSNAAMSNTSSTWEYYKDFEEIFEGVQLNQTTYVVRSISETVPPQGDPLSINDERTFDSVPENLDEIHDKNTEFSKSIENQSVEIGGTYYTINQEVQQAKKKGKKTKRLSEFKRKILELESLKIKEIKRLRISVEKAASERNKLLSRLISAVKYKQAPSVPIISEVFSEDL